MANLVPAVAAAARRRGPDELSSRRAREDAANVPPTLQACLGPGGTTTSHPERCRLLFAVRQASPLGLRTPALVRSESTVIPPMTP